MILSESFFVVALTSQITVNRDNKDNNNMRHFKQIDDKPSPERGESKQITKLKKTKAAVKAAIGIGLALK